MTAFLDAFHMQEIQWILALEALRSPVLNAFFIFLNFFDTLGFSLLFLVVVWLGYNSKWGARVFYLFILSTVVNMSLKYLFAIPRPCTLIPSLALVSAQNYSFPSGGAQNAVVFFGIFALMCKRRWAWVLAICFMMLIGLSRVYLGVHYPSDVIAGWTVGLLLLLMYYQIFPVFEKWIGRKSSWVWVFFGCLLPLLLLMTPLYTPSLAILIGGCMGVTIGLIMQTKFKVHAINRGLKARGIACLIGLLGVIIFYSIAKAFDIIFANEQMAAFVRLIVFAAMGFWLSFAAEACISLFKKKMR